MANLLKQHEFWLGMFIIALCLMLGWRSEEFFTFGNIYDLANNYAMLTILACGLFVVLIAGGIDISFPAMTIIAQYGMVVMLQKWAATSRWPLCLPAVSACYWGWLTRCWSIVCGSPRSLSPFPRSIFSTVCCCG